MPSPRPRDPRAALQAAAGCLGALLLAAPACRGPQTAVPAASAEAAGGPGASAPDESEPIAAAEAVETFDAVWTTVHDTHFDPQFNGVDWVALRTELRPRAEAVRTRAELQEVLDDLLGSLGQSHFAVLPQAVLPAAETAGDESAEGTPGFEVRLRDGRVLVSRVDPGGPAETAGVRTGWILTHVRGEELDFEAPAEGDPRLHALEAMQSVQARARGALGERVELAFLDGEGAVRELTLELGPRSEVAHTFGTTLPTFHLRFESQDLERDGRRIGRIHFTNWFLPMIEPIRASVDRMRGYDGIVIDLRGNTGGAASMVMGVAGHFFEERVELGTQHMRTGDITYVALPQKVDPAGQLVRPYGGPVAILIDEATASASEVFAGGMQSVGRARVFGETSAGAVLPASTTMLPSGDALLHAIGDFQTATGVSLESRGVIPDEPVPLTRSDLLAGRDAALEAAIDWILARASEQGT